MMHRLPTVRNGMLHEDIEEGSSIDAIAVGSAAWYAWLEHHRSFRFDHPASPFTACKEQRAGGWYWYAYRRQSGRLRSAYLGRSTELSVIRLDGIAAALAGGTDMQALPLPARDRVPALHASLLQEPGAQLLPRYTLPQPLTSLVGREQEVAAAEALLRRPEVRLLSMVGPAGVGKTCLALQVATDLLHDFPDGVLFVALAPVRNADLVISTIAQTLELRAMGNQPVLNLLKSYLRDKRYLLVLDNFEQVVSAAQKLSDLLEGCSVLKILVTSREVLHLRAERQFSVPPLALPDRSRLPDDQALAHVAAVELFIQRAQAVRPDFQLTPGNAAAIAEICIRLDGLPLAIELAAARVKLLAPQALFARLDRRLQLLIGGMRDLPKRQRTLRTTIGWSYELLPAEEQQLFRRLAVFVGGCQLSAAEALCRALGEEATTVFEGVTSLMDKSLLYQGGQAEDEPRLLMLETIREYGLERLEKSGEEALVREAHAVSFLAWAEEIEPKLFGTEYFTWVERLERELANLRAAFRWYLSTGDGARALRLSAALWGFGAVGGHAAEGYRWIEQALQLGQASATKVDLSIKAKALYGAASLAYYSNDPARTMVYAQECLELTRALGDRHGTARALNALGHLALNTGEHMSLAAFTDESVHLLREVGDRWYLAQALYLSAYGSYFRGNAARARSLIEECLALCREMGEPNLMMRVLYAQLCMQGDVKAIFACYEDIYRAAIKANNRATITTALLGLGGAWAAHGQLAWAVRLWGAAKTLSDTFAVTIAHLGPADWIATALRISFDHDPWLEQVRTRLGEEAFLEGWNEGQRMTPEQTLAAPPVCSPAPTRALQVEPSAQEPLVLAPGSPHGPSASLTHREREVLRLLAQGLTSAQIAEQLVIGVVTVNTHVRSIYSKLSVTSRSAATRYALEHHLV